MLSWFSKLIYQMNPQDWGQLSVLLHHTPDSAISKTCWQVTGNQFQPNSHISESCWWKQEEALNKKVWVGDQAYEHCASQTHTGLILEKDYFCV